MLIRKSESASGSTLVTDQAQNVYELVIASYGQRPSKFAEQYRLVSEPYFAFQWANSIGLNDFQWHQIFSGLLAHIHSNSIAHEVAELIASGKVRVYELPSIKSSGAIPFDEKSAYQFFPSVVTQYAASPYRLEKFNSVAKAQVFVNGIKWSGSSLARVASDLRMDQIIQEKIIKNGSSNLELGKQEIIKLLSEGKAVVLKVERITASPSKKSAAELLPLRTNDKPPPLAPETKNTEAAQEEKKSDLASNNTSTLYKVESGGVRGENPLTIEQRAQVNDYLSHFDLKDVDVRWVDDRNLNTAYGNMFGQQVLQIGSDVVPGNVGSGTLTANSRVSINGTLAHEIVGHQEAALLGKTQDILYLEEAQASIRAARFAPNLNSTERFTLLRDAITRLQKAPGGPVKIRDVKDSLYIQNR